ncbi:Cytochrome c oxidase subunit 4, mitochondrial [Grifola frondosa]|uniref:Cytochrome c oxidase subunit 4, mitochondrial n=1 Tax=Grifola frondosa TaxID=5627 RepID=A0A1C7M6R5_GRIFR|nr:Cytochrome c oxidase subunit 4, mitochondrial [Grifola frondosa]
MFRAAIRPAALAARSAIKPTSSQAIFGEGAKPGEVPTEENQATGLERLQVLGDKYGVEVFDLKPLDSSRIGTLADPIKVFSWEPVRHIGCTGSPAESHELLWMNLTTEKNRRCPECGSVYALDFHDPHEGEHVHAH